MFTVKISWVDSQKPIPADINLHASSVVHNRILYSMTLRNRGEVSLVYTLSSFIIIILFSPDDDEEIMVVHLT